MAALDTSFDPVAPGPRVYRAYHVGADGDFHAATTLPVLTDYEARVAAAALLSRHGIHLWERGRFLGEFPPRGAAPAGQDTMQATDPRRA